MNYEPEEPDYEWEEHVMKSPWFVLTIGLLVGTALTQTAMAQETTGVPGSPDATTTIDGRRIPPPPRQVRRQDQPRTPRPPRPTGQPHRVPPKGAPNILLIMTDDVGFGCPSTFGGVIPTPTLDRIATMGLRYTQFHTHLPVFADARGPDHRAQSSFGGIWRDQRSGDRLSRL